MSGNYERDRSAFFHYLQAEYAHPFSGWDFSYHYLLADFWPL